MQLSILQICIDITVLLLLFMMLMCVVFFSSVCVCVCDVMAHSLHPVSGLQSVNVCVSPDVIPSG